jgi:hypothetical protein
MSTSLELTITLRREGKPADGFPIVRRIEVDELQGFTYEKVADNNTTTFTAFPTNQLDTVQAFVIKADSDITVRFNNQSDAGIVLKAGGIMALFDVSINSGISTNSTVNNPAATGVAVVSGLVGGT